MVQEVCQCDGCRTEIVASARTSEWATVYTQWDDVDDRPKRFDYCPACWLKMFAALVRGTA